ncbi:copper-translocating P-type ATPase [Thalassospira xiamenensis]|nr:copper-translocating P-type ATPase [Thalassospira xiamenensis]
MSQSSEVSTPCFHCLQPIPLGVDIRVQVNGVSQPMCCHGCQAVAGTIDAHGLTHFYRFRDTSNPAQVELVPEELKALEAYDNPELQQRFVATTDTTRKQITLSVDGMTCSACAWLIEREVLRCAGVIQVQVNATTERVTIQWHDDQVKLSTLLQAIHQIGYKALPFQQDTAEQEFVRKRKAYVKRLGVAGIATMQVMMIAVGLYFGAVTDLTAELELFLWWVSLGFATPVILYSAQPFYLSALRSIQANQPNMDVPVSIALLGAYGASAYATVSQQGDVYFESVSMFTFFLLTGRYVELLAKQRAISVAANLVKLLPAIAERELVDGRTEQVLVQQLQVGDCIRVKPGATIPVDGELLSLSAQVNESLLTGESRPVTKASADQVLAGSINQNQAITIKVTATQQQTVLASIVAMQDSALASKPKLARMADKIAKAFVWRLLIVAGLTFLTWSFIDADKAFWVTLSVLVATCPCALSLAAPTAVTGAIHRLNRAALLLRNGDVIEDIDHIKTIVFDKTGTLTTGQFSILSQHNYAIAASTHSKTFSVDDIHACVAAMEGYSEHPLARPLRALNTRPAASQDLLTQIENHPGQGLSAVHNQLGTLRLGSLAWIQAWHPEFMPNDPQANVVLASTQQVLAEFNVQDELRPDAKDTIAELQQQGYKVVILTGDQGHRTQPIAASLGITQYFSDCKPADKLQQLQQLQSQAPVMMIGDGINDGPVLAQANLSMSFANAADLAKTSADAISLTGKLSHVLHLLDTGHQCRKIMKQNLVWALIYNISILPIAMAGFVTPYIAAIGMSLSSLLVLANSLRLYRK